MPNPADERTLGETAANEGSSWSALHLALFRFAFCFVALYTSDLISFFFQRALQGQEGVSLTTFLWYPIVGWIGKHLLHLAQPIGVLGHFGQDSPYEYVLRSLEVLIAFAGAVVWRFLDSSRRDYRTLNAYLRIFVRVALASEMLYYGLGKVPPSQFGILSLGRQARPLGEMWPMALLWAFMAASPGYTLICGLVEITGGLLLLLRKTTVLGALISLGAMANVLLLNIFYDVNQKIRCLYYFLLALHLVTPLLPGLWRLLVMQQPTAPKPEPQLPVSRLVRKVLLSLPMVFAIVLIASTIPRDLARYRAMRLEDASRAPDYGIWRVDNFTVADTTKPLLSQKSLEEFGLASGHDRWFQFIFDANDKVLIQLENGQYNFVDSSIDKATGDTLLADSGDKDWHVRLHLERTSPTSMIATGTVSGNLITMTLVRQGDGKNHPADPPQWISEGRRW